MGGDGRPDLHQGSPRRNTSFRWSCRMGICGSGSGGSTATQSWRARHSADYPAGAGGADAKLPVIRDLADISDFRGQAPSEAVLVRHAELPVEDGEYRQTPAELDVSGQFSMCIPKLLGVPGALDPDFLGPAAIALGQRYNLDSRDGAADRRDNSGRGRRRWCTVRTTTPVQRRSCRHPALQKPRGGHARAGSVVPWGG